MGERGQSHPQAHARASPLSRRAPWAGDKGFGRNGIPKPAGAGGGSSSSLSFERFGGPTRFNHLETTLCRQLDGGRWCTIHYGRQFIEKNERSSNIVNLDESATIEPAQRGSVLDRPGVRNPRGQDCPLFRRGQLRIARDVTGVGIDRRPVNRRRRGGFVWFETANASGHLHSPQSGPPGRDREADRSHVFRIRRPSGRLSRSASAGSPASQPSPRRGRRFRCVEASAAPAPRARDRSSADRAQHWRRPPSHGQRD